MKVRLKSFVGGLPPDILDTNRQFSLHPQYNCLLILIFSVKLAPWRACNNLTLPKVNVTFGLFSLDADSFNPVFSLVLLTLLTLELIISPVFRIELSPESACLLTPLFCHFHPWSQKNSQFILPSPGVLDNWTYTKIVLLIQASWN